MIMGQVEERGRLPGWMKFASEGFTPKKLVMLGEEKSSISLLRTMPVSVSNLEPKNVLTVLSEKIKREKAINNNNIDCNTVAKFQTGDS